MSKNLSCINVLLTGDSVGEAVFPTLINSINANTPNPVHIRISSREFTRPNFVNGKLKVEFIPPPKIWVGHRNKSLVSSNDSILHLCEMDDWDRCITFGWDQLVLGDLAELFDIKLDQGCVTTGSRIDGSKLEGIWPQLGLSGRMRELLTKEELQQPAVQGGSHLVDLKECRRIGLLNRIPDILAKLNGEDHLAFLAIFVGRIHFTPTSWNAVRCHHGNEDNFILHYNAFPKPWAHKAPDNLWARNYRDWSDLQPPCFSSSPKPKVLFLYANGRSGSTLFMRLLNRCVDDNGFKVKLNGESNLLPLLSSIISDHQEIIEGSFAGPAELLRGSCFPSHYIGGLKNSALTSSLSFIQNICGGSTQELVGMKQVNSGVLKDTGEFFRIIQNLNLISGATFIFHTRNPSDVVSSMRRTHGWWPDWRKNESNVLLQQRNFRGASKFCSSSINSRYEQLLSYDSFSSLIKPLGISLSEEDYKLETSKKLYK